MILSEKEKAERREHFLNMSKRAKADYIFTYYKWYIILGIILILILISSIHRAVTKKETLFHLGLVNVSAGDELMTSLTEDYLDFRDLSPSSNEILLYTNLYLSEDSTTENHEYAYASRMKILASINAKSLDLVLMNREAYDIFSRSGYLLDLSAQSDSLAPWLVENQVILSDNDIEFQLEEATEHIVESEQVLNALSVSDLPQFARAGFDDQVYLGIIANSPRLNECLTYMEYLVNTKNQ